MPSRDEAEEFYCPVFDKVISHVDCYETALVQEGELPITDIPERYRKLGWKEICGSCENHPT